VSVRSQPEVFERLKADKGFRDLWMAEHVSTGTAIQIQDLRKQREWSQERLGQESGMAQNVISRLENPDYKNVTMRTLVKLAAAFGVALLVRFVPYSRYLRETDNLSADALEAVNISDDNLLEPGADPELIKQLIARLNEISATTLRDIRIDAALSEAPLGQGKNNLVPLAKPQIASARLCVPIGKIGAQQFVGGMR
jgi:transcriptional regulator with XRE-family HTH domain